MFRFELETQGHTSLLTLDHGKVNEMGRDQLRAFEGLIEVLESSDVRTLVTTSRRRTKKGTPIFVGGANVKERVGWTRDEIAGHVRWQRRTLAALRRLPLFHVAVVNGLALGWGTEYLIACDYRIATPEAVFGLPETGLGILPGAGGTSELSALVGASNALRLGMTGERIPASEAERIGLVQEVVEDVDAGIARARAMGEMVSTKSPTAIAAFKTATLTCLGLPAGERGHIEGKAYEHCLDTGQAKIGRDHFDAIRAGEDVDWGPRKPFVL
ncbi:MAG TPA: enoyl-CoA hydratase/isomerase family protein [Myxococcota bacterium]|nr:enoyl-CoA hydratase/isomerase family protein [Myxococcota bacterium]